MRDTKSRVLETAILLFSQKGYDQVSMRDIANAVQITPLALYNHFKNKQQLYQEAIFNAFADKSRCLLQTLSGEERPVVLLSLDDWPQTGLPWIVFWLKELMTWGTLEPVAAYLLAKGIKFTRADAQTAAREYYKQVQTQSPNEQLKAKTIRNWTIAYNKAKKIADDAKKLPKDMKIELLRDFSKTTKQFFRVIPIEKDNRVYWLDPGGFPLAIGDKTDDWDSNCLNIFDFELDPIRKLVLTESYI